METVADLIFLGSKITADGDCSHEIKRRLLLGQKVMTNLDSIFKSRDITLPTKVRLVKAMVFPVVMYGCEGWTVKKTERLYNNCLSLTYLTWHKALQVQPCCCKWRNFILFSMWVAFHCVCGCLCVCIYTASSLSIHLLDIWVASLSWQL